jgi:hypothetical protein
MGRPTDSRRRERILDLWAKGLTGNTICERLSVSRGTVSIVVGEARKARDPRAIFHERRRLSQRDDGASGAEVIKQQTAHYMALRARQNRCARHISGLEEMQAILAASSAAVTKCPPGWHMGYVPQCLRI